MNRRSKGMTVAAVLLTVIVVVGIVAAAASNIGSQDNPLITLSYLTEKFKPQVMTELKSDADRKAEELTAMFNQKLDELRASAGIGGGQASPQPGAADVFTLVTLNKGQTLTCSIGTELLLRVGTAAAAGVSPALVDSTAGATLAPGGAIEVNHMYLITIEGNGLTATSDTVKVMVRGSYKIT